MTARGRLILALSLLALLAAKATEALVIFGWGL